MFPDRSLRSGELLLHHSVFMPFFQSFFQKFYKAVLGRPVKIVQFAHAFCGHMQACGGHFLEWSVRTSGA